MRNIRNVRPVLGLGIYTIPDASHILRIDSHKLRRWVTSYWTRILSQESPESSGTFGVELWSDSYGKALGFHTLIELYTVGTLRELGVSLQTIRNARDELTSQFNLEYPLASKGLLSDGKKLLFELEHAHHRVALELGMGGQTAFLDIVEPFCKRIEFSTIDDLAERYWPLGRDRTVVVDPHHAFGRPVIAGTNITTESLFAMYRSGESLGCISQLFEISNTQIRDVIAFESGNAA